MNNVLAELLGKKYALYTSTLTSMLLIQSPVFNLPFKVQIDTSDVGIGAVLT